MKVEQYVEQVVNVMHRKKILEIRIVTLECQFSAYI